MDNYPKHLAPEFEENGAVKTPFSEWWLRVKEHFSDVPENVARHWLHEHWSHSPYSYLPSADYTFRLVDWPGEQLWEIRSTWDDYNKGNAGCVAQGEWLIRDHRERSPSVYFYRTAAYLIENGEFPAPIIVLDNRDGHLRAGHSFVPEYVQLPVSYILIEGHRRFNMALHLQREGILNPTCEVWLMERKTK